MPWIELTEAHVKATLTVAEISKLASLRQSTKLPDIITQTVAEIRGYVRRQMAPGAGQTIPESLLAAACAVARMRYLASLPSEALLTDQRKQESENALRLLRDVAEGKFILEEAQHASTESFRSPAPSIAPRNRQFSRESAEGI